LETEDYLSGFSAKGQTMFFKTTAKQIVRIILFASFITGCTGVPSKTAIPSTLTAVFKISDYAFPHSIDSGKRYLFYLHGKIIEDQGIPAVSSDFGEYEYAAILQKFNEYGFVVISEQRPKNTDSAEYAGKVYEQVTDLLNGGVLAKNITVVGASKGAGIAIFASHMLENKEINFVIMGICHPDNVEYYKQYQIFLYGNVLSIYDSADTLAGTCQDLFSFSEGKGISKHDEIVLHVGTGHGVLYKPLDEWIIPTVNWAGKP
jgi:hypothetical protein